MPPGSNTGVETLTPEVFAVELKTLDICGEIDVYPCDLPGKASVAEISFTADPRRGRWERRSMEYLGVSAVFIQPKEVHLCDLLGKSSVVNI